MRRVVLPALLGRALALPASAQSQYADSAGTYISTSGFTIGSGGRFGTQAQLGRRFGNGVDVGVVGSYDRYGEDRAGWSAGAVVGLTRRAPAGTFTRLQASALYQNVDLAYSTGDRFASSGLVGDVSATVGRSVPVVGSLRFQPTVGVYARASQALTLTFPDRFQDLDRFHAEAGFQAEFPLTFRLFGADATIAPALRFAPGQDGVRARGLLPGGGLRLNF